MIYITKKGDTFDSIAYKVYGNEEIIAPVIQANREYVETAVFDYGTKLEIPEADSADNEAGLPPWRRGE